MRPEWSFTVHDSPVLAPPDFRYLPSVVRLRGSDDSADPTWGRWHGSGFRIRDLPSFYYGRIYYGGDHETAGTCGACGSMDTRVIFLDNCQDQSGADIDLEIQCRACGKFTLYKGFA